MRVINKDKVIEAFIREPYINSGEQWDMGHTHGWQVILVVGYLADGYQRDIIIDKESRDECVNLIQKLGFIDVV